MWALSLSVLYTIIGDLRFKSLRNKGYSTPVACTGVLLGNLSIAGLPLLAGFPVNLALWLAVSRINPIVAYLSLIGMAGLLIAAARTYLVFFSQSVGVKWQVAENRLQIFFLALGGGAMLILGIFPQIYIPNLTSIALTLFGSAP